MRLARGNDKIFRLLLLKQQMHCAHVILGVSPIALGFQIAKAQLCLLPVLYARYCRTDFARNKLKAAARTFMIEKDAADTIHAVSFPIVARQIKSRNLTDAIRRARMKRRGFLLWRFFHFAKHFRRTGEIETALRLK